MVCGNEAICSADELYGLVQSREPIKFAQTLVNSAQILRDLRLVPTALVSQRDWPIFCRYSRGFCPTCTLKARLNDESDLNPFPRAIEVMEGFLDPVSSKASLMALIRCSLMNELKFVYQRCW